jgi:release factor glutamine methyltransferase
MRTLVLPGVLRPPSDSRLLAQVMRDRGLARGATVLDVFTGSGVLAVAAAAEGARSVTAIDLWPRAVLNARLNALASRVRLQVRQGDLFEPVAAERFDLILANPPYVPAETDELPAPGPELAWEGGTDGRALLDRLCAEAPGHLRPGGSLLVVQSSLCGEKATLAGLAAGGLRAEVLARQRGPLGPIASARTEMLERRGLLAPGEREEELLVIGGFLQAPTPAVSGATSG